MCPVLLILDVTAMPNLQYSFHCVPLTICKARPSAARTVHVFFCGSSVNTSVHTALKSRACPQCQSISPTTVDCFLQCFFNYYYYYLVLKTDIKGQFPERSYIHSAWVPDWRKFWHCVLHAACRCGCRNKVDFCCQSRWTVHFRDAVRPPVPGERS